jgi:hypothetical protein
MDHVVERPPFVRAQGPDRPAPRVAQRDQVVAPSIRGIPEQLPAEILVDDRGVPAADPQAGGGDLDVLRRLAEVERDVDLLVGIPA